MSPARRVGRGLAGFVVGYAIFAAVAAAMFMGLGLDPHARAPVTTMILVSIGGIVAAAGGAVVASRIGRSPLPGQAIAALIALAALVSLLAQPGDGSRWSQVVALLLIAPAAFVAARRR